MPSLEDPLVILPAAGFGRRLGSPEAKEVLPLWNGRPLIDKALSLAVDRSWPVLVVTRKEKVSLLEHLRKYPMLNIEVVLVEPTRDWPESLLATQNHWREWNLVTLPDTDYSPAGIWDEMSEFRSSEVDLVVAQHTVSDPERWGFLNFTEHGLSVGEKPQSTIGRASTAWGLYMFHKRIGQKLLQTQLQSQIEQRWMEIESIRGSALSLESFEDLTRGAQ